MIVLHGQVQSGGPIKDPEMSGLTIKGVLSKQIHVYAHSLIFARLILYRLYRGSRSPKSKIPW